MSIGNAELYQNARILSFIEIVLKGTNTQYSGHTGQNLSN